MKYYYPVQTISGNTRIDLSVPLRTGTYLSVYSVDMYSKTNSNIYQDLIDPVNP